MAESRPAPLAAADARHLAECLARGGVAVFPTDTVYGIGCDPDSQPAVSRLYELKGRPRGRPAAVMFFELAVALQALPELGERERGALAALLPGPVTLLLPNPARRYPLACGPGGGSGALGLRVPLLGPELAALAAVHRPILQSSANLSGEPDACSIAEVPQRLIEGAELVLDGGELPGRPSSVVDLRDYEESGRWHVLREGALAASAVERALDH